MIELRHIMFATNFSENSDFAIPYVVKFAKQYGSKVTAIHAINLPAFTAAPGFAMDLGKPEESLRKSAEARMRDLIGRFAREGVDAQPLIALGPPFVVIVTAAREHDADMIVMATHGYGPVKHVLLGSTAERVVRKAPCPVLTVRHPGHKFEMPTVLIEEADLAGGQLEPSPEPA